MKLMQLRIDELIQPEAFYNSGVSSITGSPLCGQKSFEDLAMQQWYFCMILADTLISVILGPYLPIISRSFLCLPR